MIFGSELGIALWALTRGLRVLLKVLFWMCQGFIRFLPFGLVTLSVLSSTST